MFKAVMYNTYALNHGYIRHFFYPCSIMFFLFCIILGVFKYHLLILTKNPSKSHHVICQKSYLMRWEITLRISSETRTRCGWREKCIKNGWENR